MKIDIKGAQVTWFFIKPYKLQCFFVVILMFLSGFLETINLAALYPMMNYGLGIDNNNFIMRLFGDVTSIFKLANPFLAASCLLIVISVVSIVMRFVYSYFSNKFSTLIVADIQKKIFDKFVTADYAFFIKNQQGKLIYAGTTAPDRTTLAVLSFMTFVYSLINSIFLFFLLMMLSWQATLGILGLGLAYGLMVRNVMQRYINNYTSIINKSNQDKNVIFNEFITGIKTIKIFLAAGEWKRWHTKMVDCAAKNQFKLLVVKVFPETLVKFLFYMLIAVTGIMLSHGSKEDILALLPLLGTFAVVVNRFIPSISIIGSAMMSLAEYMPDTKIVYDLYQENSVPINSGKKDLVAFNNKITFENVWFRYFPTGEYLLKDLSFEIERRKMTAIVGVSGSGKTTIINLLLKLYKTEKGALKIDGTDILEISNATYLSRIGYVSQETFIINNTFKENIRFGMADCTDAMIEEAAKLANADDFIKATADGYDTVVGDSGIRLSGGQRQRVAIARAMLRKPEIIILDEATSSLDNISEKKIQKAINNISKHTTVLVIAHRLSTVQNADKIIILEKGEIKEQGRHEELLQNKSHYYDLHTSTQEMEEGIAEEK